MKHVAFFRNLNLGRPKCPSKAQFEAAFLEAGAATAASFLTNGTIVFEAPSAAAAKKLLAAASNTMNGECGLVEPAFLRTVKQLAGLAKDAPFDDVEEGSVYARCITFLHPKAKLDPQDLPIDTPRGDCHIFASTGAEVFSTVQKNGNTVGNPNGVLEKLLKLPATSRNWNTVVRLLDKHG
jgi:uncharacterized protein (DUF1697 family)